MRREFLIALFVFTIIYTLLHVYVLGRLWNWIGITITWRFGILVSLLILSFPAAMMLAQRIENGLTRLIYAVAAIWMGIIGILLFAVIFGELFNLIFTQQQSFILVVSVGLALSFYALINALFVRIKNYTIAAKIKNKTTIAVLSDLHLGPVHGSKYLRKIIKQLKQVKPDIIVLPGDLVDGPGALEDDLLTPFDNLGIPIVHSWGNHEQYLGEKKVNQVLKATCIKSLRNARTKIQDITIIGIDDSEDSKQVEKILPTIKHEGYTILLYHRPEGLEAAALNNIDLMLCGHTHAGQLYSFMPLVKTRFRRMRGWFTKNNTKMFVSTGAGTWGPPMRLGSHSEVVIITLQPK